MFKKIAVLTSRSSWFVPYARSLATLLQTRYSIQSRVFFDHKVIPESYSVVFILSYCKIIEKQFLEKHQHNLVVHASDLPKGTGWAPLFWQILEGKNTIPFVLFEADEKADGGSIYLKRYLTLRGDELHDEIRRLEASTVLEMCQAFIERHEKLKAKKQSGKRTFYARRTPKDSQIDIRLSLKKLFPLLRIVSNKEFPAFFHYKGQKYILRIHKALGEKHAK